MKTLVEVVLTGRGTGGGSDYRASHRSKPFETDVVGRQTYK